MKNSLVINCLLNPIGLNPVIFGWTDCHVVYVLVVFDLHVLVGGLVYYT